MDDSSFFFFCWQQLKFIKILILFAAALILSTDAWPFWIPPRMLIKPSLSGSVKFIILLMTQACFILINQLRSWTNTSVYEKPKWMTKLGFETRSSCSNNHFLDWCCKYTAGSFWSSCFTVFVKNRVNIHPPHPYFSLRCSFIFFSLWWFQSKSNKLVCSSLREKNVKDTVQKQIILNKKWSQILQVMSVWPAVISIPTKCLQDLIRIYKN